MSIYKSNYFTRRNLHVIAPFVLLLLAVATPTSAQQAVPVAIEQAANDVLSEEVPLTGTVTSARVATLSAGVAGLVSEMYVDVGATVATGKALIKLDDEPAVFALNAAKANLLSAEANLLEAERRLNEAKPLEKQNSIAATEIRSRESQVSIAKAAVDRARADVGVRTADLKRHTVRAPFDGVISKKFTESGEWVAPGGQVLELVSTNQLWLDFQVPQQYFPRVNQQANITISFDVEPEKTYAAKIINAVPVSNPLDRTFLLRAQLEEPNALITSGMSTHGTLELYSSKQGVSVSRDAVLRYSDGRTVVWSTDPNATAPVVKERIVTLGIGTGNRVEIKSGLNAGEWVVTRGNEALRPDQKVEIVDR